MKKNNFILMLCIVLFSLSFVAAQSTERFYTTPGDGIVTASSISFIGSRDASSGSASSTGSFYFYIGNVSSQQKVSRAFIPLNTSTLSAAEKSTISSAEFCIYITSKSRSLTYDAYNYYVLVGNTTQSSLSSLSSGDYVNVGNINSPNEYSKRLNYTSLVVSAWNCFNLTASGIAALKAQNYSKWAIREGHDINNATPSPKYGTNVLSFDSNYNTNKPYLEVTYSSSVPNNDTFVNFYLYDEESNGLINSGTLEIFRSDNSSLYTFSGGNVNVNLSAGNYSAKYYATGYPKREYFFNYDATENITARLYLLNHTDYDATHLYKSIQVVDESANPINLAIVKMQRQFVDCNCFRTVEMAKTDEGGDGVLFADLYDATYKFIVEYQGVTEKVTNQTILDTRSLYFTINLIGSDLSSFYDVATGVSGATSFDTTNNSWTFTFNDPSNAGVESGQLIVKKKTAYADTTICDTSIAGSSGALVCSQAAYINDSGTFNAYSYVTTSDGASHLVDVDSMTYVSDYRTFGLSGLFLSFLIIMALGLSAIWNPSAAIFMTMVGMILTNLFGLVSLNLTWLIGMVIVGFIFMYTSKT